MSDPSRLGKQVRRGNFEHILRLSTLQPSKLADAVRQLEHAEGIHQYSPQAAVMLCRRVLEILARQFEGQLQLVIERESGAQQGARLMAIADHYRSKGNAALRRAWEDFARLNRHWNQVAHSNAEADAVDAISSLSAFHRLTVEICNELLGERIDSTYCPPPGLLGEMEELGAISAKVGKLEGALEVERRRADDAQAAAEDALKKQAQVAQDAAVARADAARLRAKLASDDTGELRAAIRRAEAREAELLVRQAEMQRESEELREEKKISDRQSEDLARELGSLREAERKGATELAEARRRLSVVEKELQDLSAREQANAASLEAGQARLQHALAESESLKRQQSSGQHADTLRELLLASEANLRSLRERQRELEQEAQRTADERKEAVARSNVLQQQLDKLAEVAAQDAADRLASERSLARSRRYLDAYPGIEQAAAFYAEAIRDAEGPLPPFDRLSEIARLGSDAYADRYEATHSDCACILRVITQCPSRDEAEVHHAWQIETRNLAKLVELRDRKSIARTLESPLPGRPGFAVFERPNCPSLREFGRNGRSLGLAAALRFAVALQTDLAARERFGLVCSWPDLHAVAVREGSPLLLEPSAVHFGDLGPPDLVHLSVDKCRFMSREQVECAWVYVLSHAVLRLTGVLPAEVAVSPSSARITEKGLRLHLEELRQSCDVPIDLEATRALAALLVGGFDLAAENRPRLRSLEEGLRAPL
jgi:hypothetical protein